MAAPTKYTPSYNFTDYQSSDPTDPLPADKVDIELANIQTTTDETIDALADIRRSDGALNNGIVTPDSLSTSVVALLAAGVNPRGTWATATDYAVNDLVTEDNLPYICLVANTSGTFATDLAAGKWQALGPTGAIATDGSSTVTADIPFNSHKITGLSDGTGDNDAANVGQMNAAITAAAVPDATTSVVGKVALSTTALIDSADDATAMPPDQFAASKFNPNGKHLIPIGAAALTPDTSTSGGGPTVSANVTSTHKVPYRSVDFDHTTQENAGISITGPKSADEGVTLTAQFRWTSNSGSAGDGVVFGISITGVGDGDTIDVAYSTAVKVTDTLTAAGDIQVSAVTAAITVQNWAEGDTLNILVTRFPGDVDDTLAADAKLIGVDIFLTTNSATDA